MVMPQNEAEGLARNTQESRLRRAGRAVHIADVWFFALVPETQGRP
jgi:hypothetical protein